MALIFNLNHILLNTMLFTSLTVGFVRGNGFSQSEKEADLLKQDCKSLTYNNTSEGKVASCTELCQPLNTSKCAELCKDYIRCIQVQRENPQLKFVSKGNVTTEEPSESKTIQIPLDCPSITYTNHTTGLNESCANLCKRDGQQKKQCEQYCTNYLKCLQQKKEQDEANKKKKIIIIAVCVGVPVIAIVSIIIIVVVRRKLRKSPIKTDGQDPAPPSIEGPDASTPLQPKVEPPSDQKDKQDIKAHEEALMKTEDDNKL